jgi:hypothetical protein
MLSWRAGKRDTDGNWGKYWYASVEKSTGFAPYQPRNDQVPEKFQDLLAECEELYAKMAQYKLQ